MLSIWSLPPRKAEVRSIFTLQCRQPHSWPHGASVIASVSMMTSASIPDRDHKLRGDQAHLMAERLFPLGNRLRTSAGTHLHSREQCSPRNCSAESLRNEPPALVHRHFQDRYQGRCSCRSQFRRQPQCAADYVAALQPLSVWPADNATEARGVPSPSVDLSRPSGRRRSTIIDERTRERMGLVADTSLSRALSCP